MLMNNETSLCEMNTKLKTLDTLEDKVQDFEKDLERLWLHIEDKSKTINEKLDKLNDRFDNSELAEGINRDKIVELEKKCKIARLNIVSTTSIYEKQFDFFCNIQELPEEKAMDIEKIIRDFMARYCQSWRIK